MGLLSRLSRWRSDHRLSRATQSSAYREQFERRLRARYDAAQTTTDNENHWANADGLGPNAANSAAVREKVRRRARYEALENNSYAKGMVLNFSNHLIGTGPRLQVATRDKLGNNRVERSFWRWAEEVNLSEKLRTLATAYVVDGEGFAIFNTDSTLSHRVKLNIIPLECDYFDGSLYGDSDYESAGATYDGNNNPVTWSMWREHPGEISLGSYHTKPKRVDASQVLHVHRPDRPGQRRGVSHLVTALPLFAMHRRFKLATLAAAETAADFAAVIYTTNTPEAASPGGSEHWGAAVPVEHRAMMTLPDGWEMKQFSPEHPQSTLEMFETRIIAEVARCLLQPLNVASGSSKDHNFSSGKLDHLSWERAVFVERAHWVGRVVNRIVHAWLDEAAMIEGLLPVGVGPFSEWDWSYRWDGSSVIDEEKQSKADKNDLASGTTTRTDVYARKGIDIDAADAVAAAENGITVEDYRRGLWELRIGAADREGATGNEQDNQQGGEESSQKSETGETA